MHKRSRFQLLPFLSTFLISLILVSTVATWRYGVTRAAVNRADVTNGLDVEIIAAPNFVVDSNVKSPSTYAPRVATVIGKFCNTSGATLANVTGYIGNKTTGTPGSYPVRAPGSGTFDADHPDLVDGGGSYSFTHLGNTSDATRYIGELVPGQCSYQYWHFTYPACENVGGNPEEPPCSNDPVWGATNDYDDDLWLNFDIWGTSSGSGTTSDNETHTANMRNEISAMANKIEPNGNPGGQWFNTDTSTVNPGETITTNGISYRLGNVNKGFDNNADGVPDYNAWLQPFGDPSYDPSCFRLIKTYGELTVTTTSGDVIIPFTDNLYFSDLPPNNTNVVGEVYYEFLALGGVCTIPISPYQEAASGYDNEKFNGDYGSGPDPVQSFEPSVTIDKSGSPAAGATGSRVDYTIGFENTSTQADAGVVLSSGAGGTISLVISDTVPDGMTYIANSASDNNTIPSGNSVSIRHSTDSGTTWTDGDLGTNTASTSPNNLVMIEWWLDDPLERAGTGNNSGSVTFAANLPSTAPSPAFIENCAGGSFADADPFAESCTVTMISGSNTIGDFVWWDANSDGFQDTGESGIDGVTVSLYYDKNGDSELDDGDVFITSQDTASGGAYDFTNLANGDFLVVVDDQDTAVTNDRLVPTTTTIYAVNLGTTVTDYNDADFGFGPVLAMTKSLSSSDPAYEGENVTFTIDLENTRPGDGTGQGSACEYTVWSNSEDAGHTGSGNNDRWTGSNNANAFGAAGPDGVYANTDYSGGSKRLIAGTDHRFGPQSGSIVKVEAIFYAYVDATLTNDDADTELFYNDVSQGVSQFDQDLLNNHVGVANAGLLVWDVTALRTWDWSEFSGTQLDLVFEASKDSNSDGVDLYLDAMGFRITTDGSCGGADDTIVTVPLTDEFDPSLFEFVSADPIQDSVTTNTNGDNYTPAGLITWDNVGPIYAGQTKQVTVVLKALQPPDGDSDGESDPATTTNYASVTGATFANGNPINDANDDDDVTINPAGTIGDLIWNDLVSDGTYDADGADNTAGNADDELGISGVTVELQDGTCNPGSDCPTTVTDASGNYLFEGVRDGTAYVVVVDTTTLPNGGTGVTNTHDKDSDNDSDSGTFTIDNDDGSSANDDVLDADFGYTIPNTIFGNIWEDNDGDATQETAESGISGVTVYLCAAASPCDSGNNLDSTTTDANGDYQFSNMVDGTYYVGVETDSGPVDSSADWSNTVDPEGTPGDDVTAAIVVAGGNIYGSYDFGYTQTGSSSIGDTIYADWNGDGDQDTGEDGVSGVTVWLYAADSNGDRDALVDTQTTDGNGEYTFSSLPAGDFIVVVDESDLPWDYTQTQDPDESAPCTTCDGQSAVTTDGTSNYLDEDFGYQPVGYGSIGDYVWQDDNANGLQDSGEAALPNITVDLYVWEDDGDDILESGEQGAFIGTTTSATDGSYLFGDLPGGDYIVDVDESDTDLPANHVVSSKYDHDDDLTTADINNDPMGVALSEGENFLDADFGFAPGGTIGDYIWMDSNSNGEQDAGEPGINGVTVTLYNDVNGNGIYDSGTDTLYGSTTTVTNGSQNGYYAFTDLPAGDYVVVVTEPANYSLTGDPDAYDTGGAPYPPYDPNNPPDTNFDGQYGTSLLGGESDLTADFGYLPDGTIGDTLWLDFDADGVRDVGEPGIVGITVELYDSSNTLIDSTTTDSNGNYIFNSVANGDYEVQVDTGTLPTGLTQNYDPDQPGTVPCTTCDNTGSVTISGGSTDLTIDFGYVGTNSISGTVWHDDDDDAAIDGSETIRYEDVPIYLLDCGAGNCDDDDEIYLGTTLTDSSGNYTFNNLPDGTYRVLVNPNVPILDGLDPTVVATPTTHHDATLSGSDSSNNDFGFLSVVDYGDMPAAYERTISGDNGARHVISGNLYLGSAQPDSDADGQEDAGAGSQASGTGDDGDGSNDDDGVTRQAGLNGAANGGGWTEGTVASGEGGSLELTIGGTWYGVPQVFIDFDGDDTLTEVTLLDASGDPIVMPLAAGTYQVYFDIPTGTFVSQNNPIFTRVRLSSTGGLGVTGLADNGEVEDYKLDFGPTAVTLSSFEVSSPKTVSLYALAAAMSVLVVAGSGLLFFKRRHRA